jgi:hypothetical protein
LDVVRDALSYYKTSISDYIVVLRNGRYVLSFLIDTHATHMRCVCLKLSFLLNSLGLNDSAYIWDKP